ncbi:hypothetical protein I4U23_024394 [Adineta vaga]|nr:hypothetical protein I4U23_024394 [Adineta vaga]
MAFFPIYRYRVHDDPVGRCFGDQLDFFDPWNDLNATPPTRFIVPETVHWINKPKQQNNNHTARVTNLEKFRVQYNVAGFNLETMKTRVEGKKIIIEAKQEDRQPDGDYSIREVRKSCPLPEHADADHLVSYVTRNHVLVIEVPIKNPEPERRQSENQNLAQFGTHRDPLFNYVAFLCDSGLNPQIINTTDNKKQLSMALDMKNYGSEEIKVSVKNNELIIKGEHRNKDDNIPQRSFFFKSIALPPGTKVEQLQSYLTAEGQLKIEAPYEDQDADAKPAEEQKESDKSPDAENKN